MPFLNDGQVRCGLVRVCQAFYEPAPVPLKSVSVTAEVRDFVAEVTVHQEYVNREEK